MRLREVLSLVVAYLFFCAPLFAQSPNGTINGLVLDPSGRAIAGADITIVNDTTGALYDGKTNAEGIYVVTDLPPGSYRLQVSKIGFKTLIKPEIVLNVQDALAINFTLPIGAVSESVTVEAGAPLLDTQDGTVSTVVDRQFAENLPMNGRSFQTLIQLTPGVVLTAGNGEDAGQFSVNGQRADANYWMVDGVSANIGTSSFRPNGAGGSVASFSALGGTNSLVSVDAMQEFRIQTSTYAPEFGRTPGAQISIVTRSGTNQYHGTLFDYFRNDVLDANDWFADNAGLSKPKERQNDFGGTVSGPFLKDRTFFFFSYEGLRLRLPQVALDTVPDLSARQAATPALRPYLNAYPLPSASGVDDPTTGIAQFNASYSNPASLDAYSLRVDHRFDNKLSIFGRYSYSPSKIESRGAGGNAPLSVVSPTNITTQTGTVGATWSASTSLINDLRFNYSRTNAASSLLTDSFGGAVPLTSLPFPSPFTAQNAEFFFEPFSLTGAELSVGSNGATLLQQVNVVENVSLQRGSHSMKFGLDLRRLSSQYSPTLYSQGVFFLSIPSAETGSAFLWNTESRRGSTILFHNLGAFAQDTWRLNAHLTATYGLRWDLDFVPTFSNGPSLPGVTGFNPNDLSALTLNPGAQPFKMTYGNVAPRLGMAYEISQSQNWQTVLRGGFGLFYDLATSQTGNLIGYGGYPFSANNVQFFGTFPLSSSEAAPPPITVPGGGTGMFTAYDPDLRLPYSLQWNFAVEQALGRQQALSVSYIGSAGRRLLQTEDVVSPNPSYSEVVLVGNTATSDYDALQVQFQRRLSGGLQALASYTWAHSIDDASAGSGGNFADRYIPGTSSNQNRGASDFDIRHAFSAGITYEVAVARGNRFERAALNGWSIQNVIQARSAVPVDVYDGIFTDSRELNGARTFIRPDVVRGIPLYLYGAQYPGGKALNNTPNQGGAGCVGPFCPPPTDASTGAPVRQGDLGRNALRGFGAAQWDAAVHRDFPIRESLKLQFRAELFNALNHPNFGQPVADISQAQFGRSTQTLGESLSGGGQYVGSGAFSPLYQIGGPRSIQFALKLIF